ncbi:ribosome biogenesis protein SLX9-domain-containing protein [Rhodocollybia butyracea]|uniref:Ribosome biogenesis protein SLX9 n=1 Tax=Rhodocollybia butyracea TaxID=206335 RepID=A0A9P5PRN6_9AGAR|nr:ribosome biogenesis protein SLX9-domain-containing protein [Rhodocollybia butyracea]
MPKERTKRSTSHNSSVKLPKRKSEDVIAIEDSGPDPGTNNEEILTPDTGPEIAPTLKKKDKQQLKRDAFLRRVELTQSPYSKSHQRRLKRKIKEQLGQGLGDIRDALPTVEASLTTANEPSVAAGSKSQQMQVDGEEDAAKSTTQSKSKSSKIGEGKGTTLSNAQRKKALQIERLRHPHILSNPQFSSNPFETIRTHAQNTLVKRVLS